MNIHYRDNNIYTMPMFRRRVSGGSGDDEFIKLSKETFDPFIITFTTKVMLLSYEQFNAYPNLSTDRKYRWMTANVIGMGVWDDNKDDNYMFPIYEFKFDKNLTEALLSGDRGFWINYPVTNQSYIFDGYGSDKILLDKVPIKVLHKETLRTIDNNVSNYSDTGETLSVSKSYYLHMITAKLTLDVTGTGHFGFGVLLDEMNEYFGFQVPSFYNKYLTNISVTSQLQSLIPSGSNEFSFRYAGTVYG